MLPSTKILDSSFFRLPNQCSQISKRKILKKKEAHGGDVGPGKGEKEGGDSYLLELDEATEELVTVG